MPNYRRRSAKAEEVRGERQKQHQRDPALAREEHAPAKEGPMMKPLPVDQIWRTMEPSGVKVWMERPPEVSISELEKLRTKNFKIIFKAFD